MPAFMEERTDAAAMLAKLEEEIAGWKSRSRDIYFTRYLLDQKQRLEELKRSEALDLASLERLREELYRNYQVYLQRNFPGIVRPYGMGPQGMPPVNAPGMGPQAFVGQPGSVGQQPFMGQQGPVGQQPFMGQQGPMGRQPFIGQQGPMGQPSPMGPQASKGQETESKVAIAVFSVVGAAFLLAAFVILGSYMAGLWKGICLYLISSLVVLFAEAVVYRKNQKIGSLLSAIGLGCLYLSTATNYLLLHNFGLIAAILFTVAITVAATIWSRVRDSGSMRLVNLLSCYICFLLFPVEGRNEFLVLSVLLIGLNLLCIFISVRKSYPWLCGVHFLANLFFTSILERKALGAGVATAAVLFFLFSNFILEGILFQKLLVYLNRAKGKVDQQAKPWCYFFYAFSLLLYIGMFNMPLWNHASDRMAEYGGLAVWAIICIGFFLAAIEEQQRWTYYYLMQLVAVVSFLWKGSEAQGLVCVLVLFLISKALCGIRALGVDDAIVTAIACLELLYHCGHVLSWFLFVGILLSALTISRWQIYYKIWITATAALYLVNLTPFDLKPVVFFGVLFLGLFLFSKRRQWRCREDAIFCWVILGLQAFGLLALCMPLARGAHIMHFSMLVIGLATLFIAVDDSYGQVVKWKGLMLAGFLTYMALVADCGPRLAKSALFMAIALGSLIFGFARKQKSVRIFGLVLSLTACGKIALYDVWGYDALARMILFFAVGFIVLLVAIAYILLEKKV